MILLNSKSIYYDDVNLIAQPTEVKSRKEIPQELERIIVSPMQSIIGQIFANKALSIKNFFRMRYTFKLKTTTKKLQKFKRKKATIKIK
jgi:hypothetical protein